MAGATGAATTGGTPASMATPIVLEFEKYFQQQLKK